MELRQRATRVLWVDGHGLLVADARGGLSLLDEDFRLLRSGHDPQASDPIYAVTTAGEFAYTKDMRGTVTQWHLPTLRVRNSLDAQNLRGPGEYLPEEEPSTVINRGICVWQDRLYVNNGYLEVVVADANTLDVLSVHRGLSDAFIEWFCTERPGEQAIADKQGNLFIGELSALDFPVHVKIDDELNLHRVKYDRLHDRYWVTQDAGVGDGTYVSNGLVVISPGGELLHDFKFAADDVEVLEFSPDHRHVYAGGFDGELVVFDNTEAAPRIVDRVSPFRHQIIDLTVTAAGDLVVLGQDGEMERLGPRGQRLARLDFPSSCVWDIQPDPLTEDGYLLATDTGVVAVSLTGAGTSHPNLRTSARWDLDLGFVRRVRPLADGTFLGVTRSNVVFRGGRTGALLWSARFAPHPHDLAVDAETGRVLVAANEGVVELDLADGSRVRELDAGGLVPWTCSYGPDGSIVIGTRNGVLFGYDRSGEPRWRVDLDGYCKRIRPLGDRMLVTGGGFGAVLMDYADGKTHGQWREGMENTLENAVLTADRVYSVSYGLQLGVHDADSSELLGIVEPMPDFPKAVELHSRDGRDLLLVGGRGGYVQIRELTADGPRLLRTVYPPAGHGD